MNIMMKWKAKGLEEETLNGEEISMHFLLFVKLFIKTLNGEVKKKTRQNLWVKRDLKNLLLASSGG